MRAIFRNGRILDPSQDRDEIGDLVIADDQIVGIGAAVEDERSFDVYDCTGLWITPGLVDPHVHLREPGFEHKETIVTGTMAASAGGYTTIACLPDTQPPLDSPSMVDFILDRAASPEAGGVFVAPIGALTLGNRGEQLSDLAALKKAGVVAASDQGNPIQSSRMMTRAMEFCVQVNLPILAHCDDTSLSEDGAMNEGAMSAMLGLKGIPRSAEEIMVMRNCLLALHTGCQLHLMRVSTWGAVELIQQAKYLSAPVTCDIAPHHFILTDEAVGEFNPNFKTDPPLRTQVDVDILLQALNDGTIDCISSDHCPHASYEVDVPFAEAPRGVVGLESTLAATLTFLTHRGILSPLETIRKLSTTPANILKIEAGTLRPGETPVAQVTVIDPNFEWTFDTARTFSKGKNSPFHGVRFKGKTMLTVCGSEVYRDPSFTAARYAVSS